MSLVTVTSIDVMYVSRALAMVDKNIDCAWQEYYVFSKNGYNCIVYHLLASCTNMAPSHLPCTKTLCRSVLFIHQTHHQGDAITAGSTRLTNTRSHVSRSGWSSKISLGISDASFRLSSLSKSPTYEIVPCSPTKKNWG